MSVEQPHWAIRNLKFDTDGFLWARKNHLLDIFWYRQRVSMTSLLSLIACDTNIHRTLLQKQTNILFTAEILHQLRSSFSSYMCRIRKRHPRRCRVISANPQDFCPPRTPFKKRMEFFRFPRNTCQVRFLSAFGTDFGGVHARIPYILGSIWATQKSLFLVGL